MSEISQRSEFSLDTSSTALYREASELYK